MRAEYTTGEEGKGARVNEILPPHFTRSPLIHSPSILQSSSFILSILIQREFLE